MENLYIGTCSWKYDSWRGIVYSDKSPLNHLQEYGRQYNTVEIDQWFWSLFGPDKIALPSPFTVQEYLEAIPADFRFSIKVPNSVTLTHFYRNQKSDPLQENSHFLSVELFQRFLDLIRPLQEHIGPLMFQFEYLNKQKMSSQEEFQERIGVFFEKLDRKYRYFLEIRNPNYLNADYFRFLQRLNLGHVFLQGYYMPSIVDLYSKIGSFIRRGTVIRLHGPDRGDIEKESGGKWNRILQPKDDELSRIAGIVRDLLERKVEVYVNMNNHYEGSAPLSIQRLEKFLTTGDSEDLERK
ncbi:MAG: DUF72 domain-containing protein [bacterium]|nr:MAG: DUF72 domain-containing protein [bacterium]